MAREKAKELIESLRHKVDINQIASLVVKALDQGYQDWDSPWRTGFEHGDIDFFQIVDAMDERQKVAAFKLVRQSKDLSLDDVARHLGSRVFKVTPKCIQNLEEGRRRTRLRSEWLFYLMAIADQRDHQKRTGAAKLLLWQKPSIPDTWLDA